LMDRSSTVSCPLIPLWYGQKRLALPNAQGIAAEIPQTSGPNLTYPICVLRNRGLARKNACRVLPSLFSIRRITDTTAGNSKCFSGLYPASFIISKK
jgi:hypothetical protein